MLLQKKIVIVHQEIEFLGMHLKDGAFNPSDHIAKEFLKFLDDYLSHKQV